MLLAAYCGDEIARTVLPATGDEFALSTIQRCPHDPATVEPLDYYPCVGPDCLRLWCRGLDRWGQPVKIRAAIFVAEITLPVWDRKQCQCPKSGCVCGAIAERTEARMCLAAAQEWERDPSEGRRLAWLEVWLRWYEEIPWLPPPPGPLAEPVPANECGWWPYSVVAAGQIVGFERLRDELRAHLRRRALGLPAPQRPVSPTLARVEADTSTDGHGTFRATRQFPFLT